jgi:hypothetical protein
LPDQYFLVGDNTYSHNKILIPFSGQQKQDESKRTYNFYLSQMRIRIEMAFGMLTSKWRIFKTKLENSVQTNANIIEVATRLHNFVIDNGEEIETQQVETPIETQVDTQVEDEQETSTTYIDRRENILNKVIELGLERPMENIDRNG